MWPDAPIPRLVAVSAAAAAGVLLCWYCRRRRASRLAEAQPLLQPEAEAATATAAPPQQRRAGTAAPRDCCGAAAEGSSASSSVLAVSSLTDSALTARSFPFSPPASAAAAAGPAAAEEPRRHHQGRWEIDPSLDLHSVAPTESTVPPLQGRWQQASVYYPYVGSEPSVAPQTGAERPPWNPAGAPQRDSSAGRRAAVALTVPLSPNSDRQRRTRGFVAMEGRARQRVDQEHGDGWRRLGEEMAREAVLLRKQAAKRVAAPGAGSVHRSASARRATRTPQSPSSPLEGHCLRIECDAGAVTEAAARRLLAQQPPPTRGRRAEVVAGTLVATGGNSALLRVTTDIAHLDQPILDGAFYFVTAVAEAEYARALR
eukprot:TRINITY_DN45619_c0_g1_i1.p1 TRINITY_DN45619_c0_g1~~TRINITY_DN45619_c0_g1_i1.p1  ORF type:complete len:372 (+),score=49.59 TRINITY_DN45619_c0_g1_i1:76-1191(+)